MNAKNPYDKATYARGGAIAEMCANAGVLLLCAALVTLALTASLLLFTLPGALDAVAGSTPLLGVDATQVDERHAGQVIADWVDALSDSEQAIWRLRSSD